MAFTGELYKTFKEEETPSPRENFHDLGDWGHFPAEEATAWIPKPDRLVTRKEKYRPAPLVNTGAELRGKNAASRNQQRGKMKMGNDKVRFIPGIQGWFNILKPM